MELTRQLQALWCRGNERCGLVLADGEVVELPNRADKPHLAFLMTDEDLEEYRERAVASWHTHPRNSGLLSMADYRVFQGHADWQHYIIDQDRVWQYRVDLDGVVLIEQVTERLTEPRAEEGTHE